MLSTLSGTIAIKQYLSNMTGYTNVFFPSEYRDVILFVFPLNYIEMRHGVQMSL